MTRSQPEKRPPRPSANAVTARDVAQAAGVSVATVSRVLNGSSRIAEDLGLRVTSAAAQLGYTPHVAARTLASRRTRTIGAVISTLANVNFAIGALQPRLTAAGYTLLLACSNYDGEKNCARSARWRPRARQACCWTARATRRACMISSCQTHTFCQYLGAR